ncbi:MAG: GNAT family N-acetyltransferase [Oscillospiraceae bacterium]|nr:GNAT family N-acetyltransferase [Oscillospiraceae bacterium]
MDVYELYKRNFPFTVRSKNDVLRILGGAELFTESVDGKLAGAAAVSGGTVLMLCTDKEYRRRGIGSRLLLAAEDAVRRNGFAEVTVGRGEDYITPGVPTSKRYFPSVNEDLYKGLDESAGDFFEKRGYKHSEGCNIFDMRLSLENYIVDMPADGIEYRLARFEDRAAVCGCIDDAYSDFTVYYQDDSLYDDKSGSRALIALSGGTVAGALIVGEEYEGIGSIGCVAVRPAFRGRHIAVNLAKIGTRQLREAGMKDAFLSYTYSGLDKMYGYAGYKICVYYMMAKKRL